MRLVDWRCLITGTFKPCTAVEMPTLASNFETPF
jgi:hypothetical protein